MQYRKDKKGNDISLLGYGCLRFTKKGTGIDLEKAEKEILEAIQSGVNYFDTAYVYGGSEAALGEILERNHCRDKVNIATKLPHYLIKSVEGAEKLFQEELRRLRTDHVEYYLMHMLSDIATWNHLVRLGIKDWIQEKLESGQIRNIGFSFHGSTPMFKQLVDAYDWDFCQIQYNYIDEFSQAGVEGLQQIRNIGFSFHGSTPMFKQLVDAYDWDFCQIQYNYIDEFSQAGVEGLHYAYEKGIPVIIMEPLRGGRLVDLLPKSAKEIFANDPKGRTPAEMAFKWLYDQPEVICVLSGMNDMDMVRQNVKTASEAFAGCLTEDDRKLIRCVKDEINRTVKVGCTGCGYCMPCPKGVDIPGTFRCYNAIYSEGKKSAKKDYRFFAMKKHPTGASECIRCGKCETHCPQKIPIREELKHAAAELEGFQYKAVKLGAKLFKLYG